jgi:hypothetical protein
MEELTNIGRLVEGRNYEAEMHSRVSSWIDRRVRPKDAFYWCFSGLLYRIPEGTDSSGMWFDRLVDHGLSIGGRWFTSRYRIIGDAEE